MFLNISAKRASAEYPRRGRGVAATRLHGLSTSQPPRRCDSTEHPRDRSVPAQAALGVAASCVSDVCSNSIRVVKTRVQTSDAADTNPIQAAREVLAEDGLAGLFTRGLETRLAINCMQGAVFSVAWKYFEGRIG